MFPGYRPGVAQRVGRGIALFFHYRGTRRGWVVSSTPRPHFTPGKVPVPIVQEAVWAPGPFWTGGKSRPNRDSIPDSPARSQSLYWLSYRAHTVTSKEKLKFPRCRPGVAQRVGRGIALFFHDRGTRSGWVVSSTPRPHFTPGKDPVPIVQEAVWAPGPVWTGGKSRPHRDSIPDRPARSQSLCRLSYRAHTVTSTRAKEPENRISIPPRHQMFLLHNLCTVWCPSSHCASSPSDTVAGD